AAFREIGRPHLFWSAGILARISAQRVSTGSGPGSPRGMVMRPDQEVPLITLSSLTSHAYDAALALVYPQPCAICGRNVESRHDGVACATCWTATQLYSGEDTLCWKCGALSLAKVGEARRKQVRCGRCDNDAYTFARAGGSYDG